MAVARNMDVNAMQADQRQINDGMQVAPYNNGQPHDMVVPYNGGNPQSNRGSDPYGQF